MKPIALLLICLSFGNAFANQKPLNYYESLSNLTLKQMEKYHLAQGIEKTKEGHWEYAISEYAFILHYFPNHPQVLALLSDLSIKHHQTERAAKYFERAVILFPQDRKTEEMYKTFLEKTHSVRHTAKVGISVKEKG